MPAKKRRKRGTQLFIPKNFILNKKSKGNCSFFRTVSLALFISELRGQYRAVSHLRNKQAARIPDLVRTADKQTAE